MTHSKRLTWAAAVGLAFLLAVAHAAWPQTYFDNVVIILDASGSMNGAMPGTRTAKMDAAKAALQQVLLQVPDSTHVGLLVFSGENVPNEWLYPLGPRENQALTAAIDRPRPSGGTPLGKFIKIGANRLLEEREKQFGYGSYRLLIVTDGEATDGAVMEANVPQVLARGITMDVIGVAMEESHTLAKRAHSYRRADDPSGLAKALAEVLAEVSPSGTDAAGKEDFDLLAPIPVELAAAMLEALARPNNEPIADATDSSRAGPSAATPRDLKARAAAQSRPGPPTSPGTKWPSHRSPIFWVVLVIVLAIIVGRVKRARR